MEEEKMSLDPSYSCATTDQSEVEEHHKPLLVWSYPTAVGCLSQEEEQLPVQPQQEEEEREGREGERQSARSPLVELYSISSALQVFDIVHQHQHGCLADEHSRKDDEKSRRRYAVAILWDADDTLVTRQRRELVEPAEVPAELFGTAQVDGDGNEAGESPAASNGPLLIEHFILSMGTVDELFAPATARATGIGTGPQQQGPLYPYREAFDRTAAPPTGTDRTVLPRIIALPSSGGSHQLTASPSEVHQNDGRTVVSSNSCGAPPQRCVVADSPPHTPLRGISVGALFSTRTTKASSVACETTSKLQMAEAFALSGHWDCVVLVDNSLEQLGLLLPGPPHAWKQEGQTDEESLLDLCSVYLDRHHRPRRRDHNTEKSRGDENQGCAGSQLLVPSSDCTSSTGKRTGTLPDDDARLHEWMDDTFSCELASVAVDYTQRVKNRSTSTSPSSVAVKGVAEEKDSDAQRRGNACRLLCCHLWPSLTEETESGGGDGEQKGKALKEDGESVRRERAHIVLPHEQKALRTKSCRTLMETFNVHLHDTVFSLLAASAPPFPPRVQQHHETEGPASLLLRYQQQAAVVISGIEKQVLVHLGPSDGLAAVLSAETRTSIRKACRSYRLELQHHLSVRWGRCARLRAALLAIEYCSAVEPAVGPEGSPPVQEGWGRFPLADVSELRDAIHELHLHIRHLHEG